MRILRVVVYVLASWLIAAHFLRADEPALAAAVGLAGHKADEVFAEIRRRKDVF